tara:strand:+ start:309 stop:653 length:345 start_codon:yes stop_codon:yes gene_type:complete
MIAFFHDYLAHYIAYASQVVSVSKDNREKQPSVSSNVAHLTLAYEKPGLQNNNSSSSVRENRQHFKLSLALTSVWRSDSEYFLFNIEMGVPKNMVARFATANQMARPIFKTAKV